MTNPVNELCTGCGSCVSESNEQLKMKWNKYGFIVPTPSTNSNKTHFELRKYCPFNPSPAKEIQSEDELASIFLNDAQYSDPKVGRYNSTYIGYSKSFRESSSSGGLATAIFHYLLTSKTVDGIYVVRKYKGSYEYQLITNSDDILNMSKTRYIPVTMDSLDEKIKTFDGKIAAVGVACFIKSIRIKQHYNPQYKNKIKFLVGIICGGWKSRFFTDFLADKVGLKNYVNQDYRIKTIDLKADDYYFGAQQNDDSEIRTIRMREVGDMWGTGLFKEEACDYCTDVLSELCDISLGDAWLPGYTEDSRGTSIIISRSKNADHVLSELIKCEELKINEVDKNEIIKSQASSFSHRHDALKFRIFIAKIRRKNIPYVRERLLTSIGVFYAVVQVCRMLTRSKSIKYWYETRDSLKFDNKMQTSLKLLRLTTKVYHKARRIKKKLKLAN